jgi:ketosteroid isomerase-like protein
MDMGMYDTTALVFTRLIGSSRSDAQTVEVDQRYLRVYIKRADRWQAVATHAIPISPQP